MSRCGQGLMGLLLALSGSASAEVCYGPAVASGTTPTADTVFTCPTAGTQTINTLAQSGWRMVKLLPVSLGGTQTAAQLVIQRPADRVFGNGFDP